MRKPRDLDFKDRVRSMHVSSWARVGAVINSPRIVDASRVLICPEAPTRAAAIVIASLSSTVRETVVLTRETT